MASAEFPSSAYYNGVATDPANDYFYLDEGDQIIQRNAAGTQLGGPFGALTNSGGVAVNNSGDVYATDSGGGVFVFGPNQVAAAAGDDRRSDHRHPELGPSRKATSIRTQPAAIIGCEFRYGPDSGYSEGSTPCSPGAPIASPRQ